MSIEEIPQGADVSIISKNEKKARELIKKLGLKQIKGVSRVTFKQRGNLIYAIDNPDVYRLPAGTYVVFGEAKVEDMNQRLAEVAQQDPLQGAASDDKSPEAITRDLQAASQASSSEIAESEAGANDDDPDSIDESGLDSNDIDIVVEQTQVPRAKAIKALRANKGDLVNTIMELS